MLTHPRILNSLALYLKWPLFSLCILLLGACQPSFKPTVVTISTPEKVKPSDEMESYPIQNFDGFQGDLQQWKVVGDAYAGTTTDVLSFEEGKGVMLATGPGDILQTNFSHGPIELEMEVLLSEGAVAKLWLLGRYPVVLADSWKVDPLTESDAGGIFQKKGSGEAPEGQAALKNAVRAPGLWQKVALRFYPPSFDLGGQKLFDARIDTVYWNHEMIQGVIPVSGPHPQAISNDEKGNGPLSFQVESGMMAIRSIKFKEIEPLKSDPSIFKPLPKLENFEYAYYEGKFEGKIPDYSKWEVKTKGATEYFDLDRIREKGQQYGVVYTANLVVEQQEEYTFFVKSDDGSKLFLDGKLIIDNDGNHAPTEKQKTVNLKAGTYDFQLLFFQGGGGAFLEVNASVGKDPKQPFHMEKVQVVGLKPSMVLETDNKPYLLRSFVFFPPYTAQEEAEKYTYVLSVGEGQGPNYTMDLNQGTLMQYWDGPFVETNGMWFGRGPQQEIVPEGPTVGRSGSPDWAVLKGEDSLWPDSLNVAFALDQYELDGSGRPQFQFVLEGTTIKDKVVPDPSTRRGLNRQWQVENAPENLWHKIAVGQKIHQIKEDKYVVDAPAYFVEIKNLNNVELFWRQSEGHHELLAKVKPNASNATINYNLIW